MAVFFSDNFVEPTSDTVLNSHTPTLGTSWTLLFQDASGPTLGVQASTDTGKCLTAANNLGAIYTADVTYPSADYEVQMTITALSSTDNRPLYMMVRIQDVENMYAVRMKNVASGYQMYKKVAGTWSTVGSAVTIASGSVVKLQIIGTTLKLFDDGVEVASGTVSDHAAAGKAGLAVGGGAELVTFTDDANSLTEFDTLTVNDLGAAGGASGPLIDGHLVKHGILQGRLVRA